MRSLEHDVSLEIWFSISVYSRFNNIGTTFFESAAKIKLQSVAKYRELGPK